MKYLPADRVVFPGLGVGVVAALEQVPLDGSTIEAYRIEFDDDRGRLWVPVDQAGASGLRPVISEAKAEEAMSVLQSQQPPKMRANWNRRRKRYTEWLHSHDALDVARLVGELMVVRRDKNGPLSFGERRLLEQGRDLLVAEISAALGVARAIIEARVDVEPVPA